jgi:hypothetical protein
MLAQIPTTAIVNRAEAEKKVKVVYDGPPNFQWRRLLFRHRWRRSDHVGGHPFLAVPVHRRPRLRK